MKILRKNFLSSQYGFTLVELLVVIIIVSIVGGAAITAAVLDSRRSSDRSRMEATVKTLNDARTRAVLKDQIGPGTAGSDKHAALQFYIDYGYINDASISLEGIRFNAGQWEIDE